MDALEPAYSTPVMLLIAAAAVAVLLTLIIVVRMHAFVALVLVSGAGLGVFGLASIATGALRPSEVLEALGRR